MNLDLYNAVDIGLSDRGIKGQYIIVEIKDIDIAKLQKEAGPYGKFVPTGVSVIDKLPKVVLDTVAPVVTKALKQQYGVDAKISFANVPPPARPKSEFFPGLGIGLLVSSLIGSIVWLVRR